jgi:hypothetical protein
VSEIEDEETGEMVPPYYGSTEYQQKGTFCISRAFMNARLHLPNIWESMEQLQRITSILHDACFSPTPEEVVLLQEWVSDATTHPDAEELMAKCTELRYWPELLRESVAPDGPLRHHVDNLLEEAGKSLDANPTDRHLFREFAELVLFHNRVREQRIHLEKPTPAYPSGVRLAFQTTACAVASSGRWQSGICAAGS